VTKAVSKDLLGPTLIGGASRSGKTLLTLALGDSPGPVAGFPLEAVFHVYFRRKFPYFEAQKARIICEYLNRPRYVTGGRTEVKRPLDYMGLKPDMLTRNIPQSIEDPIALIGWLLDQFSTNMKRSSWAAFDLHPEFLYKSYRRSLPNLRLMIMERDPHSAIAAGLFWRTWPAPPPDRHQRFLLLLSLWHLSRMVSDSLIREHPSSVARLSFDRLTKGDSSEHSKLCEFFLLPPNRLVNSFDFIPHFTFNPSLGFLGPDQTWKAVLSSSEMNEIDLLQKGKITSPHLRSLLTMGARAPVLTRQLLEGYLYPAKTAQRKWNSLKQLTKDVRAGARLQFFGRPKSD
tara:strand:+ start:880 stop:1911 length:1032 start_codon:yes stop_codon:yes gene_type:complete